MVETGLREGDRPRALPSSPQAGEAGAGRRAVSLSICPSLISLFASAHLLILSL